MFFKKKKLFIKNEQKLEISKINELLDKVEKRFVLLAHVKGTSSNKYGKLCEFVLCSIHDLKTGPLYDFTVLTGKNSKKMYKNINESMFLKDISEESLTLFLDDLEIRDLENLYFKNRNIKFYNDTLVQRIEDPFFIKFAYNDWLSKEYVDISYLESLSHNINEAKEKFNKSITHSNNGLQELDIQM